MKKLLGIVVLGLLWCNVAESQVLKLTNCYLYEDSHGKTYKKFDASKHEKWELTINFDTGTVTGLIIITDQEHQRRMDSWKKSKHKKKHGGTGSKKITTSTSVIVNYDDKFVYTKRDFGDGYYSNGTINYITGEVYSEFSSDLNLFAIKHCIPPDSSAIAKTNEPQISSGTAFFINNKGNLLTNNHVVDGCVQSKINYFKKDYDAQLIATDKNLDLALLKVDLKPKSFLNFSSDMPKKLQKIYVAGYPFGKGLSDDLKISSGIVSSLKGLEDNSNELQVDAPINYGNSGGPIVGEQGELVAIAVSMLAKELTEGINFGIKSSVAANFLSVNDIQANISKKSSSMNNDKLLKILEESTVYTFCELKN